LVKVGLGSKERLMLR